MRKFVFITFGAPKKKFHNALSRIYNEAKQFSLFDEIICYDETELKKDEVFWSKNGSFIENNVRGYGYWIWKPYLIYKKLIDLNENDILVYADCGCEINVNGKKRFNEYIDMLDNNEDNYGIISFQMEHLEKKWTKKAILEWFKVDENIKNTGMCVASIQIIKKNNHSMFVINEWMNNMKYELINDDILNEESYFIENRHDQSIYSIIVKKYGSIKLKDETWFNDWNYGINFPILVKRNK